MDGKQEIESKIKETSDLVEKAKLQILLAHQTQYTDPEFSINLSKEAWKAAKIISDPDLELKSLISICASYSSSDFYREFEKWIDLLEERGKELNQKYALGRASLFRYAFENHFGKQVEAVNCLHQALEYFEADNNIQGKTTCYISLGNIKFNQGNYDKAYEYYQTGLKLYPDDNNEISFTLRQNIATVLFMQHEYNKAWVAYQDLLDIIPENDYGTRALILINLGNLSSIIKEIPAAIQYYDEVIKLTLHTPSDKIHVKATCAKADILIEMGKPKEAHKILKAIKNDVENTKNQYLIEKLYSTIIKYYKAENALHYAAGFQTDLSDMKLKISGFLEKNNNPEELHQLITDIDALLLVEENQR
ncbi:MAG: tetratricopeptide repeat protein [Candidatus Stygibacter frigidus]|nr:tetratricopeptide repeat protein [Candidatus Stygibacter frigidus]